MALLVLRVFARARFTVFRRWTRDLSEDVSPTEAVLASSNRFSKWCDTPVGDSIFEAQASILRP